MLQLLVDSAHFVRGSISMYFCIFASNIKKYVWKI